MTSNAPKTMAMRTARILIGGDICPVGANLPLFKAGDAKGIFNELLRDFESADLAIANLECPLIERAMPIPKTGPNLGAESGCIRGLANGRIACLGLANNHILDHGAPGVENTLRVCADAGIRTFGAGMNLDQAATLLVVNAAGLRIGLLGMAEGEWSVAARNAAGANPLDLIRYVSNASRANDACDFLIVLLHAGVEHYPYPSPRLQEMCRFLIEQGARVVVCQHSHCAGAHEAHGSGWIFYGQGNLIFDSPARNGAWNEGFLIDLSIAPDLRFDWKAIPYAQSLAGPGARRMPPERERAFMHALDRRSRAIKDEAFVTRVWEQFCRDHRHSVLSFVLGHGRLLRRLNRTGRVVRHLHGKQRLRELRNCVACDAHREILLEAVDQCLKEV
jgi:poly-gamma-glutamate synthesis protein (capsule biosynthesis protein)